MAGFKSTLSIACLAIWSSFSFGFQPPTPLLKKLKRRQVASTDDAPFRTFLPLEISKTEKSFGSATTPVRTKNGNDGPGLEFRPPTPLLEKLKHHEAMLNSETRGRSSTPILSPKKEKQLEPVSPPVTTLEDTGEFLQTIETAQRDQLVVVFFHDYYSRSCQRTDAQYDKLAQNATYADVHFARLEISHMTAEQLKSLGVEKLPYFQIYRNAVCVASFPGRFRFEDTLLPERLSEYQTWSLLKWMDFMKDYQEDIEDNLRARSDLQKELRVKGPIKTLTQERHFLKEIDESPREKLVVVLFYSDFENAAAQHQFRNVFEHYKERKLLHRLDFSQIDTNVLSKNDLKKLGVNETPFVQVYRNQKLVASFSTGYSHVFRRNVMDAINSLLVRSQNQNVLNEMRSRQLKAGV